MSLSIKFAMVLCGGRGHEGFLKHPSELQKHISYECCFKRSNKVRQKSNQSTMFDIRKCVNVFFFFSCNRLLVMLSLHRRQSNSHQFRRYDLVRRYYNNYCNNVLFIVGLWRENNQSIILLESEKEITSKGVSQSQSFKGCKALLSG